MVREGAVRSAWDLRESDAYRNGWEDGRFGPLDGSITDDGIGHWVELERLAYYQGHREGRRVRVMLGVDTASQKSRNP